jgi:hypothetical protein
LGSEDFGRAMSHGGESRSLSVLRVAFQNGRAAEDYVPASLVYCLHAVRSEEFEQLWGNEIVTKAEMSCNESYGGTVVCGRRARKAVRKRLTWALWRQRGGSLWAAHALWRRLALLFFPQRPGARPLWVDGRSVTCKPPSVRETLAVTRRSLVP